MSWRVVAVALVLLLADGLAGCAAPPTPDAQRMPPASAASGTTPAAAWWHGAGDALLSRLIDASLARDKRLQHKAAALAQLRERARHWQTRVLDAWLGAYAGAPRKAIDNAALRLDRARQRKAAEIAQTYIELRRLQAVLSLRRAFDARFRDDAQIARWRRQAGLVSAVDEGLGATLVAINADALDTTESRLAATRATLLRQAGGGSELERQLGAAAPIPELAAGAAGAAPARDRTAMAAAAAHELALRSIERAAARTAADASTAYRLGSGDFAAVYVAQAAWLDVREAEIDARVERARAAVRLSTAAGLAAVERAAGAGERKGE